MSFSVMPPTARCTNASFTSSRSSLRRLSVSASSEPCTSALRMRLSVATSPAWIWLEDVLELGAAVWTRASAALACSRCRCSRASADRAGRLLVGGDHEARRRRRAPSDRPSTCTGVDGPASLTCSPWSSIIARTRPHAAPATIGSPTLQRALVDEDGGDRAAADVEVGLEHDALGPAVGVGRELLELGDDEQLLEQVVDAEVLQGRHLDDDRVAAPRLGHEPCSASCCSTRCGIGVLAVDLVDRHDDRHLGRLGVVDRLDRLRHHAVVGRDHQDDDVGGLGAAGAHGGERLVARGVDEGDRLAVRRSTW